MLWRSHPDAGGGTPCTAPFSPLPLRWDSSPRWYQFCPKTCSVLIYDGSEASMRAGRRGRAVICSMCSTEVSSSHPAQGKHRGISALTRAHNAPLQHSHRHVPWGSAGAQSAYAPQQSLSARRCQLSLPACKVYPCKRRSVWTYRCLKGVGPELQVRCVGILLGEVSPTNRVM